MLPDCRPTAQDRCGQLAGAELAEALKALALQRSSQVTPTLDDLDVATSSFATWVFG